MTSRETRTERAAEPVGEAVGESATLAEIAHAAGVSASTVSKVLNKRADVAASTRARVEVLLREYAYRRPGPRSSSALHLVFHELGGAWAMEVIRGAEETAYEEGLSLVLSRSAGRSGPGGSWLDEVIARRAAGVLLVLPKLEPAQRERLAARGIPFAAIDLEGELETDIPAVGMTNWQGGLAATRHLIGLGHRRIGVVAGPDRMLCSRTRVDGYRAALETAGLPFDLGLIRVGDLHREAGYECGRQLLELEDWPTAVFAGNDQQALGVYDAARELGLRVPEDLSVVGFGDLAAAHRVRPPLTTVRQPLAEIAAAAAHIVIGLARGENRAQPTTRIELATELVVRGSTAPVPPRS